MVSSPEPAALTQLGRYTILHKLATGGTAEVFLARQQGPDGFSKQIVIKKLLPHLAEDRTFVKMFLNEARVAALMSHPNVVSVYDLGQGNDVGDYYIAMEYLSGCNLAELQKGYSERHGRPIPAGIAAQIGADACAGLDFAHNLSDAEGKPLHLVHRDISPENIFVTTSGCVKVLDFGIAKARSVESLTQDGQLKGKFGYLSPEQLAGAAVDHRCDVWALGVTLYGMCAGQRPFRGATQTEIFSQILSANPPPLDPNLVPPGLAEIILRALVKEPSQRFPSARAMQEALEAWSATATPGARRSGTVLSELMRAEFPELFNPAAELSRASPTGPIPLTREMETGSTGAAPRGSADPTVAMKGQQPWVPLHARVTEPSQVLKLPSAPPKAEPASRLLRVLSWAFEVGLGLLFLRFTYLAMPSAAFTALLLITVATTSAWGATPGELLFGLQLEAQRRSTLLPRSLARFALVHGGFLGFSLFVGLAYNGAHAAAAFGIGAVGWYGLMLLGSLAALGGRRLAMHDRIVGLRVVNRVKR
jgi:serine/threonine protein kinase